MLRVSALLLLLSTTPACTWLTGVPEPGLGEPVSWDQLEDWESDDQAEVWPALLHSCAKLHSRPDWRTVCRAAEEMDDPTDAQARAFFEAHFRPYPLYGASGSRQGLITGYYEPLLRGSFEPSDRYRYPLYAPPDDLLTIDLGEVYP
jgi:membrane-bound lytic murein transglycosylase A